MSNRGTVPLDSYRLAEYVTSVPCFLCEEGNRHDAERCRRCGIPMALGYPPEMPKRHSYLIATIGCAGSGKTTYLGMLADMLMRRKNPINTSALGIFSCDFENAPVAALRRCRFPIETPKDPDEWNWLHCQVKLARRRRPVELIMPDMSGAAILGEVDRPQSLSVICEFLAGSAGVMLFVDAVKVQEGCDPEALRATKIVKYLCELKRPAKKLGLSRPLAIVYTKADQCDSCMSDPAEFTRNHAPSLWQHCRDQVQRHQFFATSVAGACAYHWQSGQRVSLPLRVEPHGIIEPFQWIVEQVAR